MFRYGILNLAPGHNNVNGLKTLDLYSPPLFWAYKPNVKIVPAKDEGTELTGARRLRGIGLPNLVIQLPFVTEDEYQLVIKDILCPGLDALVTVHSIDLNTKRWKNWNATFQDDKSAGSKWQGASYNDLEFTIIDMTEI